MAVFLGYNQYWPGGFMGLWFLCPGTPDSGSGFKASQQMCHGLKSHQTDWEKPFIRYPANTVCMTDRSLDGKTESYMALQLFHSWGHKNS